MSSTQTDDRIMLIFESWNRICSLGGVLSCNNQSLKWVDYSPRYTFPFSVHCFLEVSDRLTGAFMQSCRLPKRNPQFSAGCSVSIKFDMTRHGHMTGKWSFPSCVYALLPQRMNNGVDNMKLERKCYLLNTGETEANS